MRVPPPSAEDRADLRRPIRRSSALASESRPRAQALAREQLPASRWRSARGTARRRARRRRRRRRRRQASLRRDRIVTGLSMNHSPWRRVGVGRRRLCRARCKSYTAIAIRREHHFGGMPIAAALPMKLRLELSPRACQRERHGRALRRRRPSLLDGRRLVPRFRRHPGRARRHAGFDPRARRRWRRCSSGCARRLDGRLAIVSGRSLADLERHLPLHGIAFSGSHGLELQARRRHRRCR